MAVTNELAFPDTEDHFEEMCFNLYRMKWKDLKKLFSQLH